jgi:hypothetical protein
MRLMLVCVMALVVGGCAVIPPPLAGDLPKGDRNRTLAFQARLNERYPVGSSEAALADELRREGFSIKSFDPLHRMIEDRFDFMAHHGRSDIVGCNVDWNVFWAARNGLITAISGDYEHGEFGNTCL